MKWGHTSATILAMWIVWAFTLACAAAADIGVPNSEGMPDAYALKALYLHRLASYVEWPVEAFPSPDTPLQIGLLGETYLQGHLKKISFTRLSDGRPMVIRRFDLPSDVQPCHILFVGRGVEPEWERGAVANLADHHVLLVGESEGFSERGGAVNFFFESGKLRFEVNLDAVHAHRLKISSKLLRVAKIVNSED